MGKQPAPSGLEVVDALSDLNPPKLGDYLQAVSEYVLRNDQLNPAEKKRAQIRLSGGLGRVLLSELQPRLPEMKYAVAGEHNIAGALRSTKADVSETHPLDGVRLGVELKPVNLAVGRAIWNRFGDIRAFAVNIHLKFPFAVVGGVLVVPSYEVSVRKEGPVKKSTEHLIERAAGRLARVGSRSTEGDAPHLLEAVGVIVYDPDTAEMHKTLPVPGYGLRWEEFVPALASAYMNRFVE